MSKANIDTIKTKQFLDILNKGKFLRPFYVQHTVYTRFMKSGGNVKILEQMMKTFTETGKTTLGEIK